MFVIIFYVSNKVFDLIWNSNSSIPLNNLIDMYNPPVNYDNFDRVNFKLIGMDKICVEGNKKLKYLNSEKSYDYYDTINIDFPDSTPTIMNTIFFRFENSAYPDSIYLVVTRENSNNIFWKQVFYSTVIINELNKFSENPDIFRINYLNLVDSNLLKNNDTLIQQVLEFFNQNKNKFEKGDCLTNSSNLSKVCNLFGLPCRILLLHGGDANFSGYNDHLGYPLHSICEVYSSRLKKWFVIDPTYGFDFKKDKNPLNAVEICNKIFFGREKEIIQDSILSTKRSLVGRDYFKYYENIFFYTDQKPNHLKSGIYKIFFRKYNFTVYQYTNKLLPKQDGFYYLGIKSSLYSILIILNINFILFITVGRLFKYKRVKSNNK